MKTSASKGNADPVHSSKPFFAKRGEGSFFAQTKEGEQPFFAPNISQQVSDGYHNSHKPFFHAKPQPLIQAKLTIGQPGDKYEQEADATADKIVQRLATTNIIQPKCAECEQEEKLHKKEEGEEFETVQRMPNFESDVELSPVGGLEAAIQAKCAECEKEEPALIIKGESTYEGNAGGLESTLSSTKGSGVPLPEDTRSNMESAFGADFSNVRVHTNSTAVQMNKDLSAQAFTHGSDIYFNAGKYNPENTDGQKLLTHELTHTVQQGGAMIQKEDEENSSDQSSDQDDSTSPQAIILELIKALEEELENSENRAKTARSILFLYYELDLLNEDPDYLSGIIEQYKDNIYDYSLILPDNEEVLNSEEETFRYLTAEEPDVNFLIENEHFMDNIDAYPQLAIQIVLPLVQPPLGYDYNELAEQQSNLDQTRLDFPDYLFQKGYPVSFSKALHMSSYAHIKRLPPRNYFFIPNNQPKYREDFEPFIQPSETNLFESTFWRYYDEWTEYAIKAYRHAIMMSWSSQVGNLINDFKRGDFSTIDKEGLKAFKQEYPAGISDIDQFLTFRATSFSPSFNLFDVNRFFIFARYHALNIASQNVYKILKQEKDAFGKYQYYADIQVKGLKPDERFDKAVDWSLEKGYAKENLKNFVDSIDELLVQILKERAKDSFLKKAASFVASLHPVGRLVALGYQIYETTQEVSDAIDIAEKVYAIKDAVEESENASTVVGVQHSAAKLAWVTINILPDLMEKLVDVKVKGRKKTKEKVEESKDIDDVRKLTDEQVNAEIETALNSIAFKSSDQEFNVVITLPNGHSWKRNKLTGTWCRASDECLVTYLNPDLVKELNEKADQEVTADYLPDEYKDMGPHTVDKNPPGQNKPNPRTTLGTFVHSKAYTNFINWLDTSAGKDWLKKVKMQKSDLALDLPKGNIKREFQIQHPDYSSGRKPRADVLDMDNATVHEIKPEGLEDVGFTESQQYAEWLNKYHPRGDGKKWQAGRTITYDGQKIYDLFDKFGFF